MKWDESNISDEDLLPTLYFLTDAFKDFPCQTLCQVVRQLISCGNPFNFDGSITNILPEEVPFDVEVLSSSCSALGGG